MIQRREFECLFCGEKFKTGEWGKCSGDPFRKHVVAEKTYYSKHSNHTINITIDQIVTNPSTGETIRTGLVTADFSMGQYKTTDPMKQEFLDNLLAVGSLITREQYVDSKLTEEQKTARAQSSLVEANALLEKKQEELDRLKRENEALRAGPPSTVEPEATGAGLAGRRTARNATA